MVKSFPDRKQQKKKSKRSFDFFLFQDSFLFPDLFSKSQVSSEFFIFVGLGFLIALSFEIASIKQLNDFRLQKENEAVKDLALKLQKELLIAASVEDGYVRIFQVPDNLDNINYSLKTQNSTIIVESKNSFYTVPIPKSVGTVNKNINKINKTQGVIYVN